ncbi:MAG: replicative DNA helicase [Planctomycetes bacterium]|nr:replicative DNA helicase [Planctomycetota bacterium]
MADPRSVERVPPHDIEAEAALLGAMLLDRDVITAVGDSIRSEHFYTGAHRLIHEAITALDERGAAIDAVTVKDELRRRRTFEQAGGAETLVRLMESVPSAAGARHHADIVLGCARRRALIRASQETLADCYEAARDVGDLVDRAEQRIFDVSRERAGETVSVKDLLRATFDRIESRHADGAGGLTGLDTGFADLNEQLDGLHAGNLIIVAARPSMGKTSFAMNVAARSAMKTGRGVLLFSLEVPSDQVVENLLCSTARVDAHKMRRGRLDQEDWDRLTTAAGELSKTRILIDDTPGLSALAMRAKARRIAARRDADLSLIVVDYMQLMTYPDAESRQHEITMISQALKNTARHLKVPVMALSQLNRAVDAREDHRPRMSDLRESGSIEQDADVIMFLFREAYYREVPETEVPITEVIIAKHRNGPTGMKKLHFFSQYLSFEDPARPHLVP